MSARNGDRSRFQVNRKRKLQHRQRIQALAIRLQNKTGDTAARAASVATGDKGGPVRTGD